MITSMDYNKIYAVDFDGTLSFCRFPDVGTPNTELIDFLISERETGSKVILNTCRRDKPLQDAIDFCKEHGLDFDAVNSNLPEIIERFGGDTRKINADVYIDDKSINLIPDKFSDLLLQIRERNAHG